MVVNACISESYDIDLRRGAHAHAGSSQEMHWTSLGSVESQHPIKIPNLLLF